MHTTFPLLNIVWTRIDNGMITIHKTQYIYMGRRMGIGRNFSREKERGQKNIINCPHAQAFINM